MIEMIQSTNMAVFLALLLVIVSTGLRLAAWMHTHALSHRQDRRFDARMRRQLHLWGVHEAMAEAEYVLGTEEYTGDITGADREAIIQEARAKIDHALTAWADLPDIQAMIIHEMLEERARIVGAIPRMDRYNVPRMLRQRMALELRTMAEWLQERKAS